MIWHRAAIDEGGEVVTCRFATVGAR